MRWRVGARSACAASLPAPRAPPPVSVQVYRQAAHLFLGLPLPVRAAPHLPTVAPPLTQSLCPSFQRHLQGPAHSYVLRHPSHLSATFHPSQGPAHSYALRRTFGQPGEPKVKLYRDHAAWCPCEPGLNLPGQRFPVFMILLCAALCGCVAEFSGGRAVAVARAPDSLPLPPPPPPCRLPQDCAAAGGEAHPLCHREDVSTVQKAAAVASAAATAWAGQWHSTRRRRCMCCSGGGGGVAAAAAAAAGGSPCRHLSLLPPFLCCHFYLLQQHAMLWGQAPRVHAEGALRPAASSGGRRPHHHGERRDPAGALGSVVRCERCVIQQVRPSAGAARHLPPLPPTLSHACACVRWQARD